MHGSFNPVHRHHLKAMEKAREVLNEKGIEVRKGLMAITPSKRLRQKGAEAMTDEHRLEALKIGCETIGGTNGW